MLDPIPTQPSPTAFDIEHILANISPTSYESMKRWYRLMHQNPTQEH